MPSNTKSFPSEFFDAIVPFLRGDSTEAQFSEHLGPSLSGAGGVGYYRTLMKRNALLILGSLYPAVRALVDGSRAGSFQDLVFAYDRAHPPRHYEPNSFGEAFVEFIADHLQGLPDGVDELADYEWVRYAVGVAEKVCEPLRVVPDPTEQGPLPWESKNTQCSADAPRAIVRHYDFDVLDFSARVGRGDTAALLERKPTALVIYRKPLNGFPDAFQPTLAEIVVLSEAAGHLIPQHLSLASSAMRAAARQRLANLGVIDA